MEIEISLLDLFIMGGPLMWPLALFSILTVAVICERSLFFLTNDFKTEDLTAMICGKLRSGNDMEAFAILKAENKKRFCLPVFTAAVEAFSSAAEAGEKKVAAAASLKSAETEKYLGLLSAIGTIAPITGFLGTVTGMISAFMNIASADNISAKLAAQGIFEALITTAYGLMIAVIAVSFYNIFSALADRFSFSLENSCNLILASGTFRGDYENKTQETYFF